MAIIIFLGVVIVYQRNTHLDNAVTFMLLVLFNGKDLDA